jgi:hypothetical protein
MRLVGRKETKKRRKLEQTLVVVNREETRHFRKALEESTARHGDDE